MASRFFITGVQIVMLKAFADMEEGKKIHKLLAEIEDKQYISLGEKEFDKLFKIVK
jgi:hypothetical protein